MHFLPRRGNVDGDAVNDDWREHLETVIDRSRNGQGFGHERYRELCDESHADYLLWRRRITEMATGVVQADPAPARAGFPAVRDQVWNLWRAVKAFVRSGCAVAPRSVRKARQAVCDACPLYDAVQRRCRQCGCAMSAKVYIAADQCPLDPPKWEAMR
jgi:hypothetical protein